MNRFLQLGPKIVRVAGEGADMRWEARPFPIETPRETITGDGDCLKAGWHLMRKFTTRSEDSASRRLDVSVKVYKRG